MKNRLLISVAAAALIAGTGVANAQGAGGGMEKGGAAQHSAPAGGGAATQQREDSGMKAGQSERMGGKEAQDTKGSKAQPNTASDTDRTGKSGKDMKAEGREKSGTVGQAPDKSGATTKGNEGREDKMGQGREDKGATSCFRPHDIHSDRPGRRDPSQRRAGRGRAPRVGDLLVRQPRGADLGARRVAVRPWRDRLQRGERPAKRQSHPRGGAFSASLQPARPRASTPPSP